MDPKKSLDWHRKTLALIYHPAAVVLSFYSWKVHGPSPWDEPAAENTVYHEVIAGMAIGFYMFDILWIIACDTGFRSGGWMVLLHHGLGVFVLAFIMLQVIRMQKKLN